MNSQLATWISQVHDATGFLKRLYIGLKDPVQRKRAEAAGVYAREQFRSSSGRNPRVTQFPWIGLPSEQAERTAWISAVEGLLGLSILVGFGSSSTSKKEIRAIHTRLKQELATAIKGFSSAFPIELVNHDLQQLCESVVDQAAGVARGGLGWKFGRKARRQSISRGF